MKTFLCLFHSSPCEDKKGEKLPTGIEFTSLLLFKLTLQMQVGKEESTPPNVSMLIGNASLI